jgi:polysaccharide biosynthesis/export protein
MIDRRKFLATSITTVGLSGCSVLSASGPYSRSISDEATTVSEATSSTALQYALIDLSERVLSVLTDKEPGSFFKTFGLGKGGQPEIQVGIGDSVQVTIFESSSGGLFIPADSGTRPGNFVSLPSQAVDQRGYISIPYAGEILAKNRTLHQIQADIVNKLAHRAIEPQVVASLTSQISPQVTVIGQAGAPNKITILPQGDRVLDVLARASGIHDAGFETFVTLQRGGKVATVYFLNMVNNPNENIYVKPGDTLYVYQEKRSFTAFGATGQSGQFTFEREHITLNDAVGKAGGLSDVRADPGQVFVYRLENRAVLEKVDAKASEFPPEQKVIPTIYRANFRDPSSFFVARRFFMHDRDVIYVSNSDKVELFKILELITGITGAAQQVSGDAALSKAAIVYLAR